jgi:hypothetical protein
MGAAVSHDGAVEINDMHFLKFPDQHCGASDFEAWKTAGITTVAASLEECQTYIQREVDDYPGVPGAVPGTKFAGPFHFKSFSYKGNAINGEINCWTHDVADLRPACVGSACAQPIEDVISTLGCSVESVPWANHVLFWNAIPGNGIDTYFYYPEQQVTVNGVEFTEIRNLQCAGSPQQNSVIHPGPDVQGYLAQFEVGNNAMDHVYNYPSSDVDRDWNHDSNDACAQAACPNLGEGTTCQSFERMFMTVGNSGQLQTVTDEYQKEVCYKHCECNLDSPYISWKETHVVFMTPTKTAQTISTKHEGGIICPEGANPDLRDVPVYDSAASAPAPAPALAPAPAPAAALEADIDCATDADCPAGVRCIGAANGRKLLMGGIQTPGDVKSGKCLPGM